MSEPKDVFLGFDPGGRGACRRKNCDGNCGKGNFGWSICASHNQDAGCLCLKVVKSGVSCSTKGALDLVKGYLSRDLRGGYVQAVGIDAPLFYNCTGEDRTVDKIIRDKLGKAHSTVIPVNSLKGACLVQGILLAVQIQRIFECPITEAHPGALRLIDTCMPGRIRGLPSNEHQRDATFAAYGARAMHREEDGWRDIFKEEPTPIVPLEFRVGYWMPIPGLDQV